MSLNHTQAREQEEKKLPYEIAGDFLRAYLEMAPKKRAYVRMQGAFRRAYEIIESFPLHQRLAIYGEDLIAKVDNAEVEN